MVGQRSQDLLGRSYQLMGWGLYEKFDRGIQLMKQWLGDADVKDAATRVAVSTVLYLVKQLIRPQSLKFWALWTTFWKQNSLSFKNIE